jgi:uncharacterized membrane protein
MTAPHADQLIDGYLARLTAAAADLPKSARQELIEDMRSHIAEARSREPEETDATILNILDRLGDPATVVGSARDRLGIRPPQPYRSGLLEVAAVLLVPFIWPIGVILLWISPAWNWRDKVIGTLVPPGGYMGLALLGVAFATAHSGGGTTCVIVTQATGQAIQNGCQAPLARPHWRRVCRSSV